MFFRSIAPFAVFLSVLTPIAAFASDVPAGLSIPVHISKDPTSDGVAVSYVVAEDVKDKSGAILIAKGSTGSGKIVQEAASAGFGGPGKTEVSLDNIVTADGKTMTVTSKATHYGHDTRFASIFFLGLWGYFTKGGSGKVGASNDMVFVTD